MSQLRCALIPLTSKSEKNMRLSAVAWALCVCPFLFACTSVDGVSTPVSFPASPQYKLKSVAHWKLIAQDVAAQANSVMQSRGVSDKPIFLVLPESPTPFERNFMPMLRTAMLQEGLSVARQREGAAELQVQVDRIAHVPTYRAGTLTLLGGGLLVLRDMVTHDARLTNAAGAFAAVAADVAMTHHRPPPELELILSVNIHHGGQYWVSQSHVYYLSSEDRHVYEHAPVAPPSGRVFKVEGTGGRR